MSWLTRWLGSEVAFEALKRTGTAALKKAEDAGLKGIENAMKPIEDRAQLYSDTRALEAEGVDFTALNRRYEAVGKEGEDGLRRLICYAMYHPKKEGHDPQGVLKHIAADATDDTKWQQFIDTIDEASLPTKVGRILSRALPNEEARGAVAEGINQLTARLDGVTAKYRKDQK